MEDSDFRRRLEERFPLLDELSSLLSSPTPMPFLAFLHGEIKREAVAIIQSEFRAVGELSKLETDSLAAELKALRALLTEETEDIRSTLGEFRSRESETQEQLATFSSSLAELSSDTFSLRSDLDQKPSHRDLSHLSEKLASFASQTDLEILQLSIGRCAEREEVRYLEEKLEDTRSKFEEFLPKEETEELVGKLEGSVRDWLKAVATSENLADSKAETARLVDQVKHDSEEQQKEIQREIAALSHESSENRRALEATPWKKDYNFLLDEIGKKASRQEIRQFKEEGAAILQTADRKLKEIAQTLAEYDGVLQHYDEVLLLKASRDDIKALSLRFDNSIDTSGIITQLKSLREDMEGMHEDLDLVASSLKSEHERLEDVVRSQAQVLGKKDSLVDPALLLSSVSDIRDLLGAKADRTDVYSLRDCKCEKEEVGLISGEVHTVKKQLESLAGTLYAFIKGYVDEEPSWMLAEKQKSHLLGHSLSLLNWIAGSEGKPQEEVQTPLRPKTRTLSNRKKVMLSSSLPQVPFSTPKTRSKSRKDNQACIYSPSKTLLDSSRW